VAPKRDKESRESRKQRKRGEAEPDEE